jgi:hypothetical protein
METQPILQMLQQNFIALFALLSVAIVIANGFGRRFAGGLLSHWVGNIGGTLVARLIQGAIVGGSVLLLSGTWAWAGVAVVLSFVGATWGFPGYSLKWPFINFKTSNMVPKNLVETVGLSINGVIALGPLAIGAWLVGVAFWPLIVAGLLRGPVYWLAAAYTPAWRWMEFEEWLPDQKIWIIQPTALTEFYSGAALGLGLILVFLI